MFRKMATAIWSPCDVVLLEHEIVQHARKVGDGDAFAYPAVLHLFGRISPHFEIVWQQENLRDPCSKCGQNPFLKICGLVRSVLLNFDQPIQTTSNLFPRKPVEIVLKRIGNETISD